MFKLTTPLIVLALMAVFLFLAATNIQGGWLYLVDAFLWSIILCAVLFPFLQLRRLHLTRRYPLHVTVGQPVEINVHCENPSVLAVSFLQLQDQVPKRLFAAASSPVEQQDNHGFIVSLAPHHTYSYPYQVTCHQRGLYRFERLKVGSFGPLGLFGLYQHAKQHSPLLVKPARPTRQAKEAAFQQISEQSAHMRQRKALSVQTVSHFRDYQPGDNRRWIHWKNSAKQNKLIVWESREESVHRAVLILDANVNQGAGFEQRIELAGSLAMYFLDHQYELSLYAQPADSPVWQQTLGYTPQRQVEHPGQWQDVATWLALVEPDAKQALTDWLQQQSKFNRAYLVILTAQPTAEMLHALESICQKAQSLATVFYTEPLPAQGLPSSQWVQLKAWKHR